MYVHHDNKLMMYGFVKRKSCLKQHVLVVPQSQLPVLSVPPGEDLAIRSEGHGMSPSCTDCHLPHNIGCQVTNDLRDGYISQSPHPQAAISALPTNIHFTVLRYYEESFRTSDELNWVELG